jgi:hypothetical protein
MNLAAQKKARPKPRVFQQEQHAPAGAYQTSFSVYLPLVAPVVPV